MARTSKEKDSTYNKAYYERLKADPERLVKRKRKIAEYNIRRNYGKRVKQWEQVLRHIGSLRASGKTDHEIAESYAEGYILRKTTKSKWIDFSPLKKKSLSSSSSPSPRPARTQENG